MKRMVSVIAALSVVFLALTPFVTAAVPNMIYYQGQLTDALGAPLDTMINMTFTISWRSTGVTFQVTFWCAGWMAIHPACQVGRTDSREDRKESRN